MEIFFYLAIPALFVTLVVLWLSIQPSTQAAGSEIINSAKREQEKNPEKNLPHYNELYGRLLLYIDGTLQQNKRYYRLILAIFLAGLLMIVYGIVNASLNQQTEATFSQQAWPPVIAGIATELLAAIILLIYRPVFRQTESHFKILERLTCIGMSIRVLDDLANDASDEASKTAAKADIAKLLLRFSDSDNVFVDSGLQKDGSLPNKLG